MLLNIVRPQAHNILITNAVVRRYLVSRVISLLIYYFTTIADMIQ